MNKNTITFHQPTSPFDHSLEIVKPGNAERERVGKRGRVCERERGRDVRRKSRDGERIWKSQRI